MCGVRRSASSVWLRLQREELMQEVHDVMRLVDRRRWPDSHLLSCRTRLSGAEVTSPMEGVTGTMAWLSHVPGCSRGGLYGPENIDFRLS